MIHWSSSIVIQQPPEAVFEFLANIQDIQQAEDSPVISLDLVTDGPPRQGSRYREVVRIMPFVEMEITSVITLYEFPHLLELTWTGPAMSGTDIYKLDAFQDGTALTHTKLTVFSGIFRFLEPVMRLPLIPRLEKRLVAIKGLLEKSGE